LLSGLTAVVCLGLAFSSRRSTAQPVPMPPREIIQEFPAGDKMKTAWKVRYSTQSHGLAITGAWFKKSPTDDWMKVLTDLRLSEIFVPYNNGTRIYDMGARGGGKLIAPTKAEVGVHGTVLDQKIVKEVRDTGLFYKFYQNARRGQELALWGTVPVGNYNYIIHYTFHDDGTLSCRLGATGPNFGNHYTMGHMHNGCWRINMDLGGTGNNTVKVVKHIEPPKGLGKIAADEVESDFNDGVEGGIDWVDREYTRLRVYSTIKNAHDHYSCYELQANLRPGTPRHYRNKEEFSHHDFWVTPFEWNEQYYVEVPRFAAKKRNIKNADVVIWYMSPMQHVPRDEDGIYPMVNNRPVRQGIAMVMWGGLDMRPRNLFDATPLYP
jgi:primary-amine oxidase